MSVGQSKIDIRLIGSLMYKREQPWKFHYLKVGTELCWLNIFMVEQVHLSQRKFPKTSYL
jgi:hypothetical protein